MTNPTPTDNTVVPNANTETGLAVVTGNTAPVTDSSIVVTVQPQNTLASTMQQAVAATVNSEGRSRLYPWRLNVGRDLMTYGSIMATRRVYDPTNGTSSTEVKKLAPAGGSLTAIPVAYGAARSYFETRYNPEKPMPPSCHSQDFINPDAEFAGKFSHQCVRSDNPSQPVCPKAFWTEVNGKKTPPACQEQFVVYLVFEMDGKIEAGEVYFKSTTAKAGRDAIRDIVRSNLMGNAPTAINIALSAVQSSPTTLSISGKINPGELPWVADRKSEIDELKSAIDSMIEARITNSRVVPQPRKADVVIDAEITDYSMPPNRATSSDEGDFPF